MYLPGGFLLFTVVILAGCLSLFCHLDFFVCDGWRPPCFAAFGLHQNNVKNGDKIRFVIKKSINKPKQEKHKQRKTVPQ